MRRLLAVRDDDNCCRQWCEEQACGFKHADLCDGGWLKNKLQCLYQYCTKYFGPDKLFPVSDGGGGGSGGSGGGSGSSAAADGSGGGDS
jgi:hypothetical protein